MLVCRVSGEACPKMTLQPPTSPPPRFVLSPSFLSPPLTLVHIRISAVRASSNPPPPPPPPPPHTHTPPPPPQITVESSHFLCHQEPIDQHKVQAEAPSLPYILPLQLGAASVWKASQTTHFPPSYSLDLLHPPIILCQKMKLPSLFHSLLLPTSVSSVCKNLSTERKSERSPGSGPVPFLLPFPPALSLPHFHCV